MIQLKLLLLLFQFQIVFIKGDAESHYCGLIEKKACCLGWSGKKCNEPVCEKGCGPGKCIEPNICDCRETNRFGQQCERFGAEVASVSQNIELTDQAQCTYLNGRSYKTFDRVKTVQTNFTGNMVLVQDCMSRPPTYQIIVIPQESCVNKSSDDCEITIKFLFKDSIEATYLSSQGVKVGNISYSFPYSKAEFQISDRGHYVYVKGIKDLNIFYNKKGSIFVFAPVTMKKQVCGLCGLYDGNGDDKFETVDASMNPIETDLDFLKIWLSVSRENRMKPDPAIQMVNCDLNEMATCAKVVSIFGSKFEEICYAEFCQMKNQKNSCELMRDIAFLSSPDNIVSDWRYKLDCEEPNCPNKMIWSDCGNNCNNRCGFNNDDVDCSKVCTPGCYCRKDFFWYKNQCKRADECPCEYRASAKQIDSYKFGDKMKKGCQNCLCESRGLWKCDTHDQCSSRCIITGDPHFVTFDNQHIFVEGQCQYIAVMPKEIESDMPQLSIIVENKFCFNSEDITCAKGIKILFGEGLNQTEIEIKSKTEVIINSKLVTIPSKINKGVEISVFKVTSDGLKIEAGDLFSVFRKDDSRIELVLSAKYARKVTGLCGNFNGDPEDDNIMPDGAPAKDDSELAARYRLTQTCHGEVLRQSYLGLCETSIEWGKIANEVCGKFGQGQFKDCEALVPSDKFVTQCKHDVCNCGLLRNASTINCECSAYSAYARICSIKGIQFQWRTPEFCSVICPKNMVYKECGSSCSATCRLRQRPNCDNDCIDGCQCPDDMVIEEKTGNCVKVEDCKCEYMGRDYNANEERKDRCNTCTCINGLWNCTTKDCSSQSYCPNGKVWKDCGGCQRTCRDMNLICDPNSCEPGCYCESGEVYDNNKCIPKGECPCFWQNQSFNESAVITRGPFECQLSCTCRSGKWECPKRDCEGLCKAWGESHYMSFDGKFFDFHGDCSYVLLEDYCNKKSGTFKIVVENVECGSKGTSCTKSIRFYYKDHIIHLIRGAAPIIGRNPTWSPYLGTGIFSKHDYVSSIVIITKELKIQWDRQLSVDVFLTPEYKNNVCGLCGNFDDNVDNDLRNRAGIIDADVNAFADSWKLKTSCPYPEVSKNPCDINKFRESWAIKRCSILKSETFEPCHNTVRYQLYYDKCVQDSCACDRGDDCLCVCTAISQYVHECNRYNIKIQWRNYENCPIMCPPDREYKPCEKVCPEACIGTKSCISDCMEGCYCKNNTYLKDDECVSEKPQCTCKDESGKEYPLGTTVIKNCHKCTCQINGFECEKELIHNCLTTVSTSTVVTTTIPTITSTLNETTTFSTSRSTTTKLCEKPLIISKWDYVKSISATSFSGVNGGVGEFMTEIGWEPHIIDLQPLLTIEFNNKVYIKGISLFLVNVNRYNVFVVHTGNQWNELIVNYTNTDGDARIPNIDMEITKIRFEFERAIQNKNILAKATIEGCGEKKPTTAAITPTTTKTETNTTSTISTTPTTSKTPQITTTASVCKETLTLISTKEFISEIIPSSNFENKEKILTDSWTSNVKDIAPNIMINFYKAITITEIIIENHSNIGRYTIMITEGNSYQTKILKANEENKNQYEQIKIDNINIKVINLSIMLIKKNKSEEVKLKLLIMGCTERKSTKEITTTISTQTPTVTGTGSSSQSISSTTTGTTTSRITGCKEKPVLISTEEYVKEIVVPKNGTSETSLITEIWNTTVIRTEPKFEIKFYKPVIITKIRFENIVNIETFNVLVLYENEKEYKPFETGLVVTYMKEYEEIEKTVEKVSAIKITFTLSSAKEKVSLKVIIEGCGEKETTTQRSTTISISIPTVSSTTESTTTGTTTTGSTTTGTTTTGSTTTESTTTGTTTTGTTTTGTTTTGTTTTGTTTTGSTTTGSTTTGSTTTETTSTGSTTTPRSTTISISIPTVSSTTESTTTGTTTTGSTTTGTTTTGTTTTGSTSTGNTTTVSSSSTSSESSSSPSTTNGVHTTSSLIGCVEVLRLSTFDYVEKTFTSSMINFEIPILGRWESWKNDSNPSIQIIFKRNLFITQIELDKTNNIRKYSVFVQYGEKDSWYSIAETNLLNPNSQGTVNVSLLVSAVKIEIDKENIDESVRAFLLIFGCEKQVISTEPSSISTTTEHTESTPLNVTTVSEQRSTTETTLTTTQPIKKENCSFVSESKSKIKHLNCVSVEEIEIGHCAGGCPSRSSIDYFTGFVDSKCLCCHPVKIKKTLRFFCDPGYKSVEVYIISGCQCNSCQQTVIDKCET